MWVAFGHHDRSSAIADDLRIFLVFSFLMSCAKLPGFGEFCDAHQLFLPLSCRFAPPDSPAHFPRDENSPRFLGITRQAARQGTFAQTSFLTFVGKSSAKTKSEGQNCLAFLSVFHFLPRAHNPEVAGSSPASATIRKALETCDSKAFFA